MKYLWFKYPMGLSNDKRVLEMTGVEKGKGFGIYLYIIECLSRQEDYKLSFSNLDSMKRKGFGRVCMERIIRDYRLFNIEGENFTSAILFFDGQNNETENTGTTRRGSAESAATSPAVPLQALTATADNGANQMIAKGKKGKKASDEKGREENSIEEEIEKKDFVFEKEAAGEEVVVPPAVPLWQRTVEGLADEQQWREVVCMKSGYSFLLNNCFEEALEIFKLHVVLHGKEKSIDSQEEARSYFANFVRPGQRTSIELRASLLAYEARRLSDSSVADDPYRHEQHIDGRRFYLGCPIPPDAPPRPDENAAWNEELHIWMAGRKPKPTTHADGANDAAQRPE